MDLEIGPALAQRGPRPGRGAVWPAMTTSPTP
jgi:hypothetical protein